MFCKDEREYYINSFNEYIEFLVEYKNRYPEDIWFRGQIDYRWHLEPNLYRNKVMDIEKNTIATLKYKTPDFLVEFEAFMNKIEEKGLFDITSLNKFQIMFLGQHYGLLTPVLDWTTDPLAALFFAIDGYKYDKEVYPVIYLFKPGFCNSYSDKRWSDNSAITHPICIDGKEMDEYFEKWIKALGTSFSSAPVALCSELEYSFRISRQSGNFTLHSPIQPLSYHWNDITIDNEKFADSITINPNAIQEISECLVAINLNKNTLYKLDNEKLDDECCVIRKESLDEFKRQISLMN